MGSIFKNTCKELDGPNRRLKAAHVCPCGPRIQGPSPALCVSRSVSHAYTVLSDSCRRKSDDILPTNKELQLGKWAFSFLKLLVKEESSLLANEERQTDWWQI